MEIPELNNGDYNTNGPYTIIVEPTAAITPDPADAVDYDFMNLVTLKTVANIKMEELGNASKKAIFVKSGDEAVDLTRSIGGKLDTKNSAMKDYLDAKKEYRIRLQGLDNVKKLIVDPGSFQSY